MTANATPRRIVLAQRPDGWVRNADFRLEAIPRVELRDGEVRAAVSTFSLDPYQRGRMNAGRSYAEPMQIGDVVVAAGVGEVIESRSPRLSAGELVLGFLGWQEEAVLPAKVLQKLSPQGISPSAFLGAAGLPGVTAWMGMTLIGKPAPSDTVVISAAAGAVGGVAGQLAKLAGARVVGIAGGNAKCEYVRDELGFDAAVDYRAPDFAYRLANELPEGVDLYFENVGGGVSRIVQPHLNDFARVPVCGLIAGYNEDVETALSLSQVLTRRLTVKGFICSDHMDLWGRAVEELSGLCASGTLKLRETVSVGLESAPDAFIGMLKGANVGKQLVALRSQANSGGIA